MSVRVRYAPSPTGLQHIGGVRTALFNYFFAKANNGKFILRIEDTDRTRYNPDALQNIYDTYNWLGIHWDEGPDVGGPYGPYVQSERFDLYKKHAQVLIESGHAYKCFCTSERLEALRAEQTAKKQNLGYDRKCRNFSDSERAKLEAQGAPYVIRFAIPLEGSTGFHDELLGDIEKTNIDINPDPVLIKSDGFPTYHLANIVDDHFMEITHVMRSQEWISSGPLHILLYKASNWKPPLFCHLPMVMGKDGQKLSKRHGSTSADEFRQSGYLADAVLNYVSLLGWSYDDTREFFSKADFENLFTIEKLSKSGAIFDYQKLDWFNGQYIRKLTVADLSAALVPYLAAAGFVKNPPTDDEATIIEKIIPLVQERLTRLSDVAGLVGFIFKDDIVLVKEELVPKKLDAQKTIEALAALKDLVPGLAVKSPEEIENIFRALAEKLQIKLGDLLMPLRVALTGSKVSPPLVESILVLGTGKTLDRIEKAIALLGENV
ncbi:MAG: glutamate--tRNA ligase [Spirochaetaceae bacterium]|nr:MAG: glutamate--tRNA ligase [Spirochaetaceae bacterium]